METQHSSLRLTRATLQQHIVGIVHRGKGYQSSVYLVEVEGRTYAVKDFRNTPFAFRTFVAPFLVKRESRALRFLAGTPGVPRYYGRIDARAFAMEYISGTPIAEFGMGQIAPEVFPRIQEVIDGIHERGVSHGDLKRRSNLILTPDHQIYLIDFAAAVIGRRPLRPLLNWFQKQMELVDNKSLPRLKKFVAPELLTEADLHKLNNPTGLEKWARKLFNR
jgi:predicted Ser/Thr protein kinase